MNAKRFRKRFALLIPTLVIIFFFIGFLFAPNDPMKSNLLARYADPSAEYPFGTDAFCRCILSRLRSSTRRSAHAFRSRLSPYHYPPILHSSHLSSSHVLTSSSPLLHLFLSFLPLHDTHPHTTTPVISC